MVYLKLYNNKNRNKHIHVKPPQVSSVHDSEYIDGVSIINMINGNQFTVVGESDDIIEMVQEAMYSNYTGRKNNSASSKQPTVKSQARLSKLDTNNTYKLFDSITDNNEDIQDVRIMKPPVISPFDVPPVLPKQKEEHVNMFSVIMNELSNIKEEGNIIKPLIFGDEAANLF